LAIRYASRSPTLVQVHGSVELDRAKTLLGRAQQRATPEARAASPWVLCATWPRATRPLHRSIGHGRRDHDRGDECAEVEPLSVDDLVEAPPAQLSNAAARSLPVQPSRSTGRAPPPAWSPTTRCCKPRSSTSAGSACSQDFDMLANRQTGLHRTRRAPQIRLSIRFTSILIRGWRGQALAQPPMTTRRRWPNSPRLDADPSLSKN
jgi:hypothetical protein